MKFDCLVIGAGLSGAISARLLAEAGKKVLVMEKLKHTGGHCHDYLSKEGITVHTYGPHIFHTESKKVWDFLNRFTSFHLFQHKVLSYAEGLLLPFPINLDTINMVYGTSMGTEDVPPFLAEEVKKSSFSNPPANFKDAVISQVGERFYNMFFKNYTIKQWERDPTELSAELAKRIPVRTNRDNRYFSDKYQGIPEDGYTKMTENILNHENIILMAGADYFVYKDAVYSSGKEPEITVYTGNLDEFFNFKHGKLQYRSLHLEFKTENIIQYQKAPVVNYPNDYNFTRITEFKQFTGEAAEIAKSVICMEYPKETGEPYYIVPTEDNMKKRGKYIEEVEALEKEGTHVFTGRLAQYKYYNMDQAILAAMEKIESRLKREKI